MAHFGTLRDYQFAQNAGDIRGAELYGANDEKLGKIDDVIFDHTSGGLRYAVVETGGWLHSKKFLVPTNQIFARPKHEDDFAVNLTKEQIERLPVYDDKTTERHKDFRDYEQRYRKEYTTAGVMHRVSFEPGDRLAMYTDGIVESENAHAEEFGAARLSELLKSSNGNATNLLNTTIAAVEQWRGPEREQSDDLTLLIAEHT